jgi:putative DNA primase/helicase
MAGALADFGVRPCGTGWISRCPAHDDRHASLAIGVGGDGRALLYCHGNCKLDSVLRALGLSKRDMFPRLPARTDDRTYYDYRDENGRLLFQVVRKPTPDGKEFVQRRPDGCGGFLWDVEGVRRVLYRLPELLAANPSETVFIVEGEKDVEALRGCGLVATTNPGGAGKWCPEYAEPLRGRKVVILPDNDPPGMAHGEQIEQSLAGVAAGVRMVNLLGLAEHGDVSDWLAAGHDVTYLRKLVRAAPSICRDERPQESIAPPGKVGNT